MNEQERAFVQRVQSIPVPAGAKIAVVYRVSGLRTQVAELMATMPALSTQMFLERRAAYETAIAWIEDREG